MYVRIRIYTQTRSIHAFLYLVEHPLKSESWRLVIDYIDAMHIQSDVSLEKQRVYHLFSSVGELEETLRLNLICILACLKLPIDSMDMFKSNALVDPHIYGMNVVDSFRIALPAR